MQLWIAFVLCTFGLIYSPVCCRGWKPEVVNCFRSLYLWVDLQHSVNNLWMRVVVNCFRSLYLWVDLQLFTNLYTMNKVVNCFRSLYLWVDLQLVTVTDVGLLGCELLSFFVPLGWFTAKRENGNQHARLWIAFVLCTFGLIYSFWFPLFFSWLVVNCFRSLYLWVDLQQIFEFGIHTVGCELLSFFVPLGWFTASTSYCPTSSELWIAFVLCTFGLIYSIVM